MIWLTEERSDPTSIVPKKLMAAQWIQSNEGGKAQLGWAIAFSLELLPAEVSYIMAKLTSADPKNIFPASTYFIDDEMLGVAVGQEAYTLFAAKLAGLVHYQANQMKGKMRAAEEEDAPDGCPPNQEGGSGEILPTD
jgi:hypothetical protein